MHNNSFAPLYFLKTCHSHWQVDPYLFDQVKPTLPVIRGYLSLVKSVLKYIFRQCMRLLALPLYLLYRLEAAALGERKAFTMACQGASLVPGITGEYFRRAFLAWSTGCPLADCCIGFGTTFSDPRVRIEDGVYLGLGCDIGYAHIGKNCLIGSGVHI